MSNVTSYSAFTDAQSQNDISRNVRQYSDLDLFFFKKQGSGDVNRITDVEAVKRSVRNLILLNSDTVDIVEYVEKSIDKNKKNYNFWKLINND